MQISRCGAGMAEDVQKMRLGCTDIQKRRGWRRKRPQKVRKINEREKNVTGSAEKTNKTARLHTPHHHPTAVPVLLSCRYESRAAATLPQMITSMLKAAITPSDSPCILSEWLPRTIWPLGKQRGSQEWMIVVLIRQLYIYQTIRATLSRVTADLRSQQLSIAAMLRISITHKQRVSLHHIPGCAS